MKLVDLEGFKFDLSGLAYISPTDMFGIGEYFMRQLSNLPSVQPEQQWIPVTERLPNKKGKYLCTVHYAVPPYHMFHPELDTYVDEISIQEFKEAEDGNVAFIDSVVSWMPLPAPYRNMGNKEAMKE